MHKHKMLVFISTLFITSIAVILILFMPGHMHDAIQSPVNRLFFSLRGEREMPDNFLLVYMDDVDMQALGGWPLTRDYFGFMTHALKQAGAAVIAFDFLFEQPSRNYPESDRILADFFESSMNVCVPAAFSSIEPVDGAPAVGGGLLLPFEGLRRNAAQIGFSNLGEAPFLERVPVVMQTEDSLFISFGAAVAKQHFGDVERISFEDSRVLFHRRTGKDVAINLDARGNLLLNHFGRFERIQTMRFVSLLKAFDTNPDSLRLDGKIVFVASTALSQPVIKATPFSSQFPGVLVHATAAENIIEQTGLHLTPVWLSIVFVVFFASLLLLFQNRPWAKWLLLIIPAFWLLAFLLFSVYNTVLPIFFPSLTFILLYSLNQKTQIQFQRLRDRAVKERLRDRIQTKKERLTTVEAELNLLNARLEHARTEKQENKKAVSELRREHEQALSALEAELKDFQADEDGKEKVEDESTDHGLVHAPGSALADVLKLVKKVAPTEIPVLLQGETGTGKELIANSIHKLSPRKSGKFVAVNCAALPDALLESELFGHEKGSFTGATGTRKGRFELADGGTIFLDEITETTPVFQTKLLRILQEGTFERLGSEKTRTVSTRVLAASNTNLQKQVDAGQFRADLYYRLNGVLIHIPPLRKRPEDIPCLARHFSKRYSPSTDLKISSRAMERMKNTLWKGNIRQLQNAVRRAAIMARSEGRDLIRVEDLPDDLAPKSAPEPIQMPAQQAFEDQVLTTLRAFQFNRSAISETAKALGNRDRGTITEYYRGICFRHLAAADYHIQRAAQAIAATENSEITSRVERKIENYLKSVRACTAPADTLSASSSLLKGLPKMYHDDVRNVLTNLDRITR